MPSRRQFLQTGAFVAGSAVTGRLSVAKQQWPLRLAPNTPVSRVVSVRSDFVVGGNPLHLPVVADMLDQGMQALAGVDSTPQAWHTYLSKSDLIGIKFNRSGQTALGTTSVLASAIVRSIISAGWSARDIVCIEAPPECEAAHTTQRPASGFDSTKTRFGSGSDNFASVLDQVTALIDVPFIKTHNIVGLTCCLKNLSHGLVKHPASFHANGCSPFISDIISTDKIRGKLRLCIVDGMRVVFAGGPEPTTSSTFDYGALLFGTDPVALDATSLDVVNQVRLPQGLPPVARAASQIAHIALSHRRGLGVAVPHGIEVVRRSVGSG